MAIAYTESDYGDVAVKDNVRVAQNASSSQYALHQFRDFAVISSGSGTCSIEWYGQTTLNTSVSAVFLQIWNVSSSLWETLKQENSVAANTNFSLTADMPDLTNYKDDQQIVTCRVYQQAG